ncbi:MAG: sel1 repeat family protein [Bacteroidetes bacterium]|nr:sel1 repeat family protein [Bacteroidota bacterium]
MVHAQGYPNSPVFRGYRPESSNKDARNDGLRKQINIFLLERDAANGDPLAQHELGVRLLTGNGVAADTVKSAYWIEKAALQELPPAMYNYAMLLNNGRGTVWNPFKAYRLFRAAAEKGMVEAQHVTGIFYTDNLVVPRNWDSAWVWVDKAAQAGYEPALRAKQEIQRRGYVHLSADSARVEPASPKPDGEESSDAQSLVAWTPVLLDFSREAQPKALATPLLFDELLASRDFTAGDSLSLGTLLEEHVDTAAWLQLTRMAEWGNPEALALLGRLYDEGIHVTRNRMTAASLFVTAIYLESARAPALLIELLRNSGLPAQLPDRAWGGDAQAQYVWASLKAMDIDTRLSDAQALGLLKRAAVQQYAPALVQLGICYATGRWVTADTKKATALWTQAASLPMDEARLRLAAARVFGQNATMELASALSLLEAGAKQGSLLAQVALASTYERGTGRTADIGEAARRYRDCAVRGSQTAFNSLKRMYDDRRPLNPAYRVESR